MFFKFVWVSSSKSIEYRSIYKKKAISSMCVKIVPIENFKIYKVNDHIVYKNNLRNWSCQDDLSDRELEAFEFYENLVIKNKVIEKHLSIIYI